MRWLKIAGFAASAALLVWLLARNAGEMPAVPWSDPRVAGLMALALGLYAAGLVVGGANWRLFLRAVGADAPAARAASQLLIGQIGKYLPGNVGQFAGRIALAREDGAPATRTAAALALELAVVAGACLAVAAAAAALAPETVVQVRDAALRTLEAAGAELTGGLGALVWAGLGAMAVAGGLLLMRLFRSAGRVPRPALLAPAFAVQCGATALHGISFHAVAVAATGAPFDAASSVAAYGAATVIGLLTPGAPGGIGAREAALVALLGPAVGEGAALAAALVHRAVSILGDGAAAGIGIALRRASAPPAATVTRAGRR